MDEFEGLAFVRDYWLVIIISIFMGVTAAFTLIPLIALKTFSITHNE